MARLVSSKYSFKRYDDSCLTKIYRTLFSLCKVEVGITASELKSCLVFPRSSQLEPDEVKCTRYPFRLIQYYCSCRPQISIMYNNKVTSKSAKLLANLSAETHTHTNFFTNIMQSAQQRLKLIHINHWIQSMQNIGTALST